MYRIQTRHPLASHSVDHTHPRGTKNDNSINLAFNRKLLRGMVPDHRLAVRRVLDLGCSGGGFVKSLVDDGIEAVGIEGSDYSRQERRAEWGTIPTNLFTADIAQPFYVLDGAYMSVFDVVTAWEVLEHLGRAELEILNLNVMNHLRRFGLFIASINTHHDIVLGRDYHVTVEPRAWWEGFFSERGWTMRPDLEEYFAPDWVRGPNTEGEASTCFVVQK